MATTVSINSVDRTTSVYVGGVSIEERLGSRATMRAELYHTDAWRPGMGEDITMSIDGTSYFAGVIIGKEETCINAATSMLRTTVTATDYTHYTDRAITGVLGWEPDGTHVGGWYLREILNDICTRWLNNGSGGPDYDITVHGSQVLGPQFNYLIKAEWVTVTDVLNNLTTLSGYIWSIDSSKQLRFVLPTDTNTPAELTVSNTLKGATVSQEFTDYCNGIYVLSKNGTTTYLETSGEVSTYKHWQKFINAPELEAAADATALCQKTLDRYGFVPKIVRLQTRVLGFHPGQHGLVTLPLHDLSGSPSAEFMIQSVTYNHLATTPGTGGTDADRWICDIEALGGYTKTGGFNWVDQWQGMMSGSGQSSMSVAGATFQYNINGFVDFQAPLGGSRQVGVISDTYVTVPNAINVTVDSAKYSSLTVKARIWVRTDNAGTTVTPRIVNLTDGGTTAGTGTAGSNTTWDETAPQTFDITLGSGTKLYQLRVTGSNTNYPVYAYGVLYVA